MWYTVLHIVFPNRYNYMLLGHVRVKLPLVLVELSSSEQET